jgi:hypothetical protein
MHHCRNCDRDLEHYDRHGGGGGTGTASQKRDRPVVLRGLMSAHSRVYKEAIATMSVSAVAVFAAAPPNARADGLAAVQAEEVAAAAEEVEKLQG